MDRRSANKDQRLVSSTQRMTIANPWSQIAVSQFTCFPVSYPRVLRND
jgi:hypothetical protein